MSKINFIFLTFFISNTINGSLSQHDQYIENMILESKKKHQKIIYDNMTQYDNSISILSKQLEAYIEEAKKFRVIINNNNNNDSEAKYHEFIRKEYLNKVEDINNITVTEDTFTEYAALCNEFLKLNFYDILLENIQYGLNTKNNPLHNKEKIKIYNKLKEHIQKFIKLHKDTVSCFYLDLQPENTSFYSNIKKQFIPIFEEYAKKILNMNEFELELFNQHLNENLSKMPQNTNLGTLVENIEKNKPTIINDAFDYVEKNPQKIKEMKELKKRKEKELKEKQSQIAQKTLAVDNNKINDKKTNTAEIDNRNNEGLLDVNFNAHEIPLDFYSPSVVPI